MKKPPGKGRQVPKKALTPVIAGRVPEALHRKIRDAAKQSGRTMSDEMAWRVAISFEWEKLFGTVEAARRARQQAEQDKILRGNLAMLRARASKQVAAPPFGPANPISAEDPFIAHPAEVRHVQNAQAAVAINQQFEETLERVVTRAVQAALVPASRDSVESARDSIATAFNPRQDQANKEQIRRALYSLAALLNHGPASPGLIILLATEKGDAK